MKTISPLKLQVLQPIRVVLLLVSLFLSGFASSQETSNWTSKIHPPDYYLACPDLESVVNEFILYYGGMPSEYTRLLRFVKNLEGWEIHQFSKENVFKIENIYPFWSYKSNGYLMLPFPFELTEELPDTLTNLESQFLDQSDFYRLNLFYGGVWWEKDVIKVLEPHQDSLTNDDLYKLARAHSNLSLKLLWPEIRAIDKENVETIRSEADINRGIFHGRKAIEYLSRIEASDSGYHVFVGNIRTAISNQYMTMYSVLTIFNRTEDANVFLLDDLYDLFMIEHARNILNACDENSILFTNGDSDTYPILWLQNAKGERRDVTVINISLIQSSEYIGFLIGKEDHPKSVEVALKSEFYGTNGENYYYWLTPNNIEEEIQLPGDLAAITKDKLDFYDYEGYLKMPILPTNMWKVTSREGFEFEWINTTSPISRDKLFFFDLFGSNFEDRSFYFVKGSLKTFMKESDIDRFKYTEGLVDILNFELAEKNNWHELYDRLVYKYNWSGFNGPSMKLEFYRNQAHSYHIAFVELARTLSNKNADDSLKIVVDRFLEVMPDSIVPFEYSAYLIARTCFAVNLKKRGEYLIRVYGDRLARDFEELLPLQEKAKQRMLDILFIQKELIEYSEEEDLTEVKKRLIKQREWTNEKYNYPSHKLKQKWK